MEPFQDVVDRLSAWATEHDLIREAEEGCDKCFLNEGGMIDGWTIADLRKEFRLHSLCFQSKRAYPYVTTGLDLFAPDGIKIGAYRLITLLDGEIIDDILEIDFDKQKYLNTLYP